MRFKLPLLAAACAALFASPAAAQYGGGKDPIQPPAPRHDAGLYEGGRGLITTEGPSGLFINPTSGTLPEHAATLQYCFLLPTNDFSEVMGHGALLAFGVNDFLEIGAVANYVDFDNGDDPSAVGPMARLRLMKDTAYLPEVSVGYYGKFGDDALDQQAAFAAFYKRIPIGDEQGFVRSLGIHGGVRNVWDTPENDETFRVYGGVEVQLPLRFYLVGEVSSDDNAAETPYAYGVQWRLGGINVSVAGVQNGNLQEDAFYFGVGTALTF